jgi:hypothetical protein
MSADELSPDVIRAALERLGLDPTGVDLTWLAWVKHDTEQRLAEHRRSPEFAPALVVAAVPPSE